MSISTTSPALVLPAEVHLRRLPLNTQLQLEALLDRADWHADHRELSTSKLLHAEAATLIGIRLPDCGELVRCTCQSSCYCTVVFDAAKARSYQDGTIWFVQCPQCADDHRRTGDE